jgi:hypothetical protein
MTLAASFLGGAKGRLLPPSIPFRFFAAAAVFHVAMWAVLLTDAEEALGFRGGLGPPLASVHALTFGVLIMSAIGASVQLLPVATRRGLSAIWPIRLVFWLAVPGLAVLVFGMYARWPAIMLTGAVVATAGLLLFAALFADNLRRAGKLPVVVAYGWTALAALFGLLGLGLALAFDYDRGFLADHAAVALAHMILGGFGFMGMLALGFSHILVPMFALGSAPAPRVALMVLGLAVAALALGVAGAVMDVSRLVGAAAVIGLAAVGLHVRLMAGVLAGGMRKRLGLSFLLIRTAWAMLPLSLLVGLAALNGWAGANGPTLFGLVVLYGWLLTFLLGILQRIVPFLASMHATPSGGVPPLLSEIAASWPLKVHAGCHLLALCGLAVAIAAHNVVVMRAAGGVGLAGALAFGWFMSTAIRRLERSASS